MSEAWLGGEVGGVPAYLQPVAHALIQVAADVPGAVRSLPGDALWAKPGGSASIAFHAVHLAGALDRLFTYARGEALSPAQNEAAAGERSLHDTRPSAEAIAGLVEAGVAQALDQLRATGPSTVLYAREVGRAKLPSTVLGLLFHAAEHSTRHAGQIETLIRVLGARPASA